LGKSGPWTGLRCACCRKMFSWDRVVGAPERRVRSKRGGSPRSENQGHGFKGKEKPGKKTGRPEQGRPKTREKTTMPIGEAGHVSPRGERGPKWGGSRDRGRNGCCDEDNRRAISASRKKVPKTERGWGPARGQKGAGTAAGPGQVFCVDFGGDAEGGGFAKEKSTVPLLVERDLKGGPAKVPGCWKKKADRQRRGKARPAGVKTETRPMVNARG